MNLSAVINLQLVMFALFICGRICRGLSGACDRSWDPDHFLSVGTGII